MTKVVSNFDKKTKKKLIKKKFKNKEKNNFKTSQIIDGFTSKEIKSKNKKKNIKKPLEKKKIEFGLPDASDFWNVNLQSLLKPEIEDESSSDEEDDKKQFKKNKRITQQERMNLIKIEEERLRKVENDFAANDKQPDSPDHFDRLVLATPNNSIVWINYMVYHLQATEIDKARVIARRALKTISFREEDEKLNIWIALLNLEIRYGHTESFNQVFNEALNVNDQFKLYSRTIEVLTDSKKVEQLTEFTIKYSRKFGTNPMTWELVAIAYFKVGLIEKAKQQLSFALNRLEKKQHVNMIIRFAALNNQYEQTGTSYALFDQILVSYPIRIDVWSRYVDILVKRNKIDMARQLLERGISQKIKLGSIRKLYNKYIDFEEKNGDPKNIAKIKERAAEFLSLKMQKQF